MSKPSSPRIQLTTPSNIQRTASQDSLTTHPLAQGQLSHSPKYPTYTPRHKQQSHADLSKPHLVHLKAAAQALGVDRGSVGWAILERLVEVASEKESSSSRWANVWSIITAGNVTLLLPLEQAASDQVVTPELVENHVILAADDASVVTLSGIRGTIAGDTLTLRSTLSPTSKSFQALLSPTTRSQTFSSLPPLSQPLLYSSCPTYALSTRSHALPLPIPPSVASKPTAPVNARLPIPNPFASLFGKPAGQPIAAFGRPASPSIATIPPSPATPALSLTPTTDESIEILTRPITSPITSDLVSAALTANLHRYLERASVPEWVVDRTMAFAAALAHLTENGSETTEGLGTDELAEKVQEFYHALERDLNIRLSDCEAKPQGISPRKEVAMEKSAELDSDGDESDTPVRDVLEAVENAICTLFYDRLFRQPTTDDPSHDKALASRITALNRLDLGLEHLDVDVGGLEEGSKGETELELDSVIRHFAETLMRLDVSWTPATKACVLVDAHRVVVDGLSRLASIRLRPESAQDTVRHPGGKKLNGSVGVEEELKEMSYTPPTLFSPSPPAVDTPKPVSGDILLPLLIFAVVKANPPHLVSQLLFIQRFRNERVGGEESYCLTNFMAVAEFLENVDLVALGLEDGTGKILSAVNLAPLPMNNRSPESNPDSPVSSLRGRVEHRVDAFAGSANKVISGVVDTSFGVFRLLLPAPAAVQPQTSDQNASSTREGRPEFGLLRRGDGGFSIASIAASLPGRDKLGGVGKSETEEAGRQLLPVPSSRALGEVVIGGLPGAAGDVHHAAEGEGDEAGNEQDEEGYEGSPLAHDSRSIRSFESMMRRERERDKKDKKGPAGGLARKTLSERLAHAPGLSKSGAVGYHDSPPASRPPSLLPPPSSGRQSPVPGAAGAMLSLAPPIQRFLECAEDDIRVSEVGELLREYRRLVEGVRAAGGFDE